jgi:CheY-like chemotaxis protein
VAHEFNNVMMGIQPLADGIRRRAGDDPALLRFTELISSSLQRGKRLTTDILRFGRPAQLALASVNVDALLKQVAEEVGPLLGEQIELEVSCEEELYLHGDAGQLTQVLMNLALNARDAMEPAGSGRLSISAERAREGAAGLAGSFVHISVRDTGSGIAPDDLPYIFEPLFTTKNRGTGFGLSVAFQVVTAHDGQIVAESRPGEGTTFHIVLPAVASPAEKRGRPVEATYDTPRSLRVLIVEDDETVGTGLRLLLEGEGMDVRVVVTGAEVMPAIADRRPDVIVLDLSLPDEDGGRTYKRIASEYSIPVIFSSGHATGGEIDDLVKKPRAAFLLKPYRMEDLLEAIRNLTRE